MKMTIIMRDLMQGNPKLKELGFKEEALGHNAIAAGFKGSVSGPISIRMATSLKHYSILRSIGMVFVRLLSLQQKTMLVTVWLCCLVIC